MNKCDWAWLAGFLDGEGSFQIVKYRTRGTKGFPSYNKTYEGYAVQVVATSVDKILLNKCRQIAGGCIYGPIGRKHGVHWKPAFRWNIKAKKIDKVIDNIIPFLISKRKQAIILRDFRKTITIGAPKGSSGRNSNYELLDIRKEMKKEINLLNKRGR
jgi:hypothetical protein